jgi:hypothetical protein
MTGLVSARLLEFRRLYRDRITELGAQQFENVGHG